MHCKLIFRPHLLYKEDNGPIVVDFCKDVDWSSLFQGRDQWRAVVCT
jgi:hypothetical protein